MTELERLLVGDDVVAARIECHTCAKNLPCFAPLITVHKLRVVLIGCCARQTVALVGV